MIRSPRTLRRRLATAVLGLATGLLVLSTGPAWAADTVQGSPQPDSAPMLAAGTFSDTVKSGETLYYAVTLRTGQSAKARFTVDGTKNTEASTGGGGEVWSVTEDGDEYDYDNACCHRTDVWTLTTETGTVGPDSSYAKDAGTYYFKYHLNGYAAGLTFPVKITVLLAGDGAAAASSEDPGTSASTAGSSSSDGSAQGGAASSSTGGPQAVAGGAGTDTGLRFALPVVLGVGGAGLLVGIVGGAVIAVAIGNARRPRRPY
jgi:hypothetical protein